MRLRAGGGACGAGSIEAETARLVEGRSGIGRLFHFITTLLATTNKKARSLERRGPKKSL